MSANQDELDSRKVYERALYYGCGYSSDDLKKPPHKEMKKRLKEWERPEPRFKTGYLNIYRKIVSSAKNGAYLQ